MLVVWDGTTTLPESISKFNTIEILLRDFYILLLHLILFKNAIPCVPYINEVFFFVGLV